MLVTSYNDVQLELFYDFGSFVDELTMSGPQRSYAGAARAGVHAAKPRENEGFTMNDRDNHLPNRPCTAVINPRGPFAAADIFNALKDINIDPQTLGCVQRKSNREVNLTFRTSAHKERFLCKSSITVNRQRLAIQDADRPLTFLNIYYAPHKLPGTALINRLSLYCEVLHHRRGKFHNPSEVCNGIRHYRVRITIPLPSYLRFGKVLVALKHDGQEETCRRCNLPGHYAHTSARRLLLL